MNLRIVLMILVIFIISCKKQNEWLNAPRSKSDIVFQSLKDYQELLNNTGVFNIAMPGLCLASADNIYIKDQHISSIPPSERNAYLWNKDIYETRQANDYNTPYKIINHVNVILESIAEYEPKANELEQYHNIIGQALFFRSYMYSELAGMFCKQYVLQSASTDKGLCLRVSSDINKVEKRSSIADTYKRIIEDAKLAATLLPPDNRYKSRPSKIAVHALLARVYLNMGDFERSKLYADSVINAKSHSLINYNSVPNQNLQYRFPDFKTGNAEIIFFGSSNVYAVLFPNQSLTLGMVDTTLYRSYSNNDLRKKFFYSEYDSVTVKFIGSYTGAGTNFSGLGLNEIYLIRAECNIRLHHIEAGILDLNELLVTRYVFGKYVPYHTTSEDSALVKIFEERRKELPFTGQVRWQDLRRMNLNPRLATPIYRKYQGNKLELLPNDKRFIFPIPQSEIKEGVEQNER